MRHDFLDKHSRLDSPVHELDARAKVVAFFALIVVGVSTPPDAWAAFAGYFAFLLAVAVASAVPLGYVFRRSLVVIPFVLFVAIFIPFLKPHEPGGGYSLGLAAQDASRSGWMIFWNVLVKSCMAITAMILLSATTPFPNLLHALERLRVPRIFVMLASFAYRYLFVLVDEAERMERARDSRCYTGRWLWHAGVVGQTIGMLFLRSYERAERVYAAMVSRGFTGEALPLTPLRMRGTDAAFLIASVGFFGLLRVGGR